MRTDERIVQAMGERLRHQGYAATGVKQVADAAGVPIGSLYHFFPGGKREIASAALRATGAAYIQLLPLFLDPHDDLVAGVEAFFAAAAEDAESNGWLNMCPVGTVTGEVADSEPALHQVAEEVLGSWISQGTDYLRGRGLEDESARTATVALLGALEGAFLLSRGLHSAEPLLAAGRSMAAYVATFADARAHLHERATS